MDGTFGDRQKEIKLQIERSNLEQSYLLDEEDIENDDIGKQNRGAHDMLGLNFKQRELGVRNSIEGFTINRNYF
jgi:hypothetical protein